MSAPTTTTANGLRAGELSAVLDQAIVALTSLDAARLEELEGSVSALLEGIHARSLHRMRRICARLRRGIVCWERFWQARI